MSQEQEAPMNSEPANDQPKQIIVQQCVYQFALLPMPDGGNKFLECPPGFRLHSIHPIASGITGPSGTPVPRALLAVLEGYRQVAIAPDPQTVVVPGEQPA